MYKYMSSLFVSLSAFQLLYGKVMVCRMINVLTLVVLFGCVYAQWSGGLNGNYNFRNRFGRLEGSLGYKRGGFSVSGSGFVDTNRNWGAGVNLKFRFRRALGGVKPNFHLLIQLDPCQFGVYDSNMDGVVTREEIQAVFAEDGHLAETLFGALDSIKGDGLVTPEVFNYLAPKIIYGCGIVKDISNGDANDQTEEIDGNVLTRKGSRKEPI